ncbi:MAG: hypothetical protein ABIW96_09675, partial [Polaromonas sp.]
MKKTLLASAIALAFVSAWANPKNYGNEAEIGGSQTQTATATSTQSGAGPQANEYSKAIQDNSQETKNSNNSDSSQRTKDSYNIETNTKTITKNDT